MKKNVLITGSSKGLGKSIAFAFARAGYDVIVNSKSSEIDGLNVVKQIISSGGNALYIKADVSNSDDVKLLFQKIKDTFGKLDVLVNNAGITNSVPLLDVSAENLESVFKTNVTACVLCSIEYGKLMLSKRSGSIINTSSVRGELNTGRPGLVAYSASKAALNSVTVNFAKEFSPFITVNSISPGFIQSRYIDTISNDQKQEWLKNIPINKFIDPDELGDFYVAVARATFITGSILVADGGFSMKFS